MAIEEARLEDVGSGLAPASPGWFVVNAGEAAWVRNDALSSRCTFESGPRVLAERPDLEPQRFPEVGITLAVLEPGKPSSLYHAESAQEDFLVLAGTCVLVIEERRRELRAWDFVHCPPGPPGARSSIRARIPHAPTTRASRPRRTLRPRPTRRSRPGGSLAPTLGPICPGPDESFTVRQATPRWGFQRQVG